VRKDRGVAFECAVAQVAVFERGAVFVILAVARDLEANALAALTLVCDGARVLVVALGSVV